jgi:hypothetical protein
MATSFRDVDPGRGDWKAPAGVQIAADNGRLAAMIEPTRLEILNRLPRLSELAPEMRFGQLIANLAFLAAGPWDQTLWDLEGEKLVQAIRQLEADLSRRDAASNVTCPRYA